MDRSPGFGSTPSNLIAHLRLAFATAPHLKCLTLLLNVTRWPVLQKVRGHSCVLLHSLAPSACKHTVSGSLSLPSRGAFHLSLTVLYSIGHQVVFSLGRWASLLHAGFLVSDATPDHHSGSLSFRLQGFYLILRYFPAIFDYN